jgi:hypothetical protein
MRSGKPLVKVLGPVLLLTASLALPVDTVAAPAQRSRGHQQGQVIDGYLNNEGAECPALRDHGGRLWTLTGDTHGLRPGEHVRLYGRVVDLEVKNVWADDSHTASR